MLRSPRRAHIEYRNVPQKSLTNGATNIVRALALAEGAIATSLQYARVISEREQVTSAG